MTVGELTFEEFLSQHCAKTSYLVIYNCGGVVKTLTIDQASSRLLDLFTGIKTLRQIFAMKNIKGTTKINEFLAFAVKEQMIQSI
jgi:hypothetical protein